MLALSCFEYSIAPVKSEMDRGVHETLLFGIETAIETKETDVVRKWDRTDTGKGCQVTGRNFTMVEFATSKGRRMSRPFLNQSNFKV